MERHPNFDLSDRGNSPELQGAYREAARMSTAELDALEFGLVTFQDMHTKQSQDLIKQFAICNGY